jgi:hypothetical protein
VLNDGSCGQTLTKAWWWPAVAAPQHRREGAIAALCRGHGARLAPSVAGAAVGGGGACPREVEGKAGKKRRERKGSTSGGAVGARPPHAELDAAGGSSCSRGRGDWEIRVGELVYIPLLRWAPSRSLASWVRASGRHYGSGWRPKH